MLTICASLLLLQLLWTKLSKHKISFEYHDPFKVIPKLEIIILIKKALD